MEDAGVCVDGLKVMAGEKTSFTEVMSIPGGQRTFFVYAGASGDFGIADFTFRDLSAKILHLGYFLLLQKIDDGDGLKILEHAQKCGIETSIDLVTENSDRYSQVIPCLPYTDYLIVNEQEAGRLTGVEPTEENLEKIARQLLTMGVRKRSSSICQSAQSASAKQSSAGWAPISFLTAIFRVLQAQATHSAPVR